MGKNKRMWSVEVIARVAYSDDIEARTAEEAIKELIERLRYDVGAIINVDHKHAEPREEDDE